MRPRQFAVLLPLALWGCNREPLTASEESTTTPPPVVQVARPNLDSRSTLGLIHAGNRVDLGDSPVAVFQVFGKPKTSFEFTDLPPGFQSPYSVKGWETAKEGVGVILYGDKVVAIMRQLTRADKDLLQEIVDTISKENRRIKPSTIQGSNVSYTFWEESSQRLMICALQTKRDGLHITEALGDDNVMDALGMNKRQSKMDQPKVDALVTRPKA